MEQIAEFLAGIPLFSGFSQEELNRLIEASHLRSYVSGDVIIQFGQPGKFLGVMLDGEAEAVVSGDAGKRIRLGLLKQGDILGEMSLLTGEPTSADVLAISKCHLFLISHEIFSTFVAVNVQAVKVLAQTITARLKSRQENEEEQSRVNDAWKSQTDPYGLGLSTTTPLKILVINCGLLSIEYCFFNTGDRSGNTAGVIERAGDKSYHITGVTPKGEVKKNLGLVGYEDAFKGLIDMLVDPVHGVIRDRDELSAIGHRVVHGGDKYGHAELIDDSVLSDIDKYAKLAPLHNPPNLMVIKMSQRHFPNVPQVAVFDTGFHQKMPAHACVYGLPHEYFENDKIRRFGFHGISHKYAMLQAATYLKEDYRELKLVTCHLDQGASLCAIDHGRSVDTSMGMTPLAGLMMDTRCGDMDPSIVTHLCREKGLSPDEVDELLNLHSGLKGLSGISRDLNDIEAAANKGDSRAQLTIQAFCYRIRKYIGAYTSALGGLHALVFTGRIAESSAWVRGLACQGLLPMGVEIDDKRNKSLSSALDGPVEISDKDDRIKVLVIPADEGRMIARETIRALGRENVSRVIQKQKEKKFPIEVSAHHVHLATKEISLLFGEDIQLTHRSDLSQPGQFACQETVNLVGPKGRVDRVRVLGPKRKETQVEISMTEEFKLGVKAPIRASGSIEGTPGLKLEGSRGSCAIPKGVICSFRHIHMPPEDALSYGLKDGDLVMVRVEGERTLIFGDVLVRVHPDFRLAMHIDTDEANAANIKTGMEGTLVCVQ
ncbi:MAG: acetate/propionate family kinase [Desulfobacteraceae bacterium]|nr:acetate/propionate family kinase [Desulfobacteraceae bacterium]